ncbi:MAG: flotillin-like FloA family protein, partial [Phycisphaera sp.]|nr:flotillin-like FloA family protein [Phycisphaera sp.]
MRTAQATTALALTLTPAGQALAQSSGGGGFRPWMIVVGVIAILVFLILMFVVGSYIRLYIQAFTSNARVTILDLVGMRLRNVDPKIIVLNRIRAVKAGLGITTAQLEEHLLSGGRIKNVVSALIAAKKARIDLDWNTACSIDLAGRDIFDAVNTSVNPKVIDCPNP